MAGKGPKWGVQNDNERTPIPKEKKARSGNGGVDGPPEEGSDPCDILIEADLESIRADVLAVVQIGEILRVEIVERDGIPSAVCRTFDGAPVGSLSALSGLTQLIRCIRDGVKYEVTITELDGGRCRVRGARTP